MTWDEMTNEERAALVNRIGDARVTYTRGDGVVEIKRHHFDRLRDQIEADGKRIAELEAEVERLTYDGIHSCHDQCQRVACVLGRRVDELEAALQKIRDRKWDTMKQGCDAAAAAMTIAEKALGETK